MSRPMFQVPTAWSSLKDEGNFKARAYGDGHIFVIWVWTWSGTSIGPESLASHSGLVAILSIFGCEFQFLIYFNHRHFAQHGYLDRELPVRSAWVNSRGAWSLFVRCLASKTSPANTQQCKSSLQGGVHLSMNEQNLNSLPSVGFPGCCKSSPRGI